MTERETEQITSLLVSWRNGDMDAQEVLLPLVYDELRRMARRFMRGQKPGHTMQTTELIHEAYLRLARQEAEGFDNRAHFFAVASRAMRHILVDHARARQSQKRGGWQDRVTFDDALGVVPVIATQVVRLDDAMQALATIDQRKSKVVELKYFGGLTNEEVATVLGVSAETVKRDWKFSRTWLRRELEGSPR